MARQKSKQLLVDATNGQTGWGQKSKQRLVDAKNGADGLGQSKATLRAEQGRAGQGRAEDGGDEASRSRRRGNLKSRQACRRAGGHWAGKAGLSPCNEESDDERSMEEAEENEWAKRDYKHDGRGQGWTWWGPARA